MKPGSNKDTIWAVAPGTRPRVVSQCGILLWKRLGGEASSDMPIGPHCGAVFEQFMYSATYSRMERFRKDRDVSNQCFEHLAGARDDFNITTTPCFAIASYGHR